jgi:hypothetical protein
MGLIAAALKNQSSYAAKRGGLWEDLMARLTDAVMPEHVDAFEAHLLVIDIQIPGAWREPLEEIIAKRREEIAEDEVSAILRDRFDF